MRRLAFLAACFLLFTPCFAQTYTPKQVRLEGAGTLDQAELLRTLAIKPGAPVTKSEIEAALQRLADTGSFSDLSYKVDANALVFLVKPVEGAQALPVRFSNFVWWRPEELGPLVEARVPLFKGKLPLTGSLTDQVIATLVALLAERGIPHAKVIATMSALGSREHNIDAVALVINTPQIILGDVRLQGASPDVQTQLDVVTSKLAGREFDSAETPATVRQNIADTHLNAGFLDVTVDEPVFGPPHQDMLSWAVDATATVHPGALYRIAQLDLAAAPPLTQPEAHKAVNLQVGAPASAMDLRIAEAALTRAYGTQGHLEAHIQAVSTRNPTTHTVIDHFSIDPGALDHFASLDTSALPADLRAALEQRWHPEAGAPMDSAFTNYLFRVLRDLNATNTVRITERLDRAHHTVAIVLTPTR